MEHRQRRGRRETEAAGAKDAYSWSQAQGSGGSGGWMLLGFDKLRAGAGRQPSTLRTFEGHAFQIAKIWERTSYWIQDGVLFEVRGVLCG